MSFFIKNKKQIFSTLILIILLGIAQTDTISNSLNKFGHWFFKNNVRITDDKQASNYSALESN
ncbi:MAG: hypothetical protein LBC17_03275, partial [Lactobacillaceae bacterium]|nr:hypothetical protein [Lactobacillaceae bacterium]